MNIDWSKAPEDATHAGIFKGKFSCWYKLGSGWAWEYMSGLSFSWEKVSGNLPASDLIERPKKQEAWDGEGLPPVGMVCEYQTWINREWKQTKILAHHLGFAVHSWSVDGDDMEVDASPPQDFRSVRAPEQLAEEERDKARTEVLNAMTSKTMGFETEDQWQQRMKVVGEMLDMGYRKQ